MTGRVLVFASLVFALWGLAPGARAFDLPDLPNPDEIVFSGARTLAERAGLSGVASQLQALLKEVRSGLPLLSELGDPLSGDVAGASRAALARLSKFTRLLGPLRGNEAKKLIANLTGSAWWRAIPDGGCSFEVKNLGRALIFKKGSRAGLFLRVDGPEGVRALVGVSNANPLLSGFDGGRMDNPGELPVAVIDIARGEREYLQARAGLGELPPLSVRGKKLVEIAGQYFEVSLGMFDPGKTKVEITFSAGLKGTVDYLAEGEISAEVELGIEVSPHRAIAAAAAVRRAMRERAAQVGLGKNSAVEKSPAGARDPGDGRPLGEFTPSKEELRKLAEVFRAGLDALARLEKKSDDDSLGEASLGLKLSLEGGLGIWDTKLPVATLETGISVSVPLEAMLGAAADLIINFVESGARMLPFMLRVSGMAAAGRSQPPTPEETQAFAEGARSLLRGALRAFGRLARQTTLGLSVELSALGEDSGGKGGGKGKEEGGKADTNITLFSASVDLPTGEALDAAIENGALISVLRALTRVAALGHPAFDGFGAEERKIFKEVAQTLVKGATIDLEVGAPVLPGLSLEYETSGAELLEALSSAARGGRELLSAMRQGLRGRSLAKLVTSELRSFARDQFNSKQLREGAFTLSFGLGTDFDVGAEGAGSLGLGATGYLEANPEFFLLWLGDRVGRPDATGRAALGLDVEVSLEGEISAGEGVEVSAGAGGTVSLSPLRIEFCEAAPPPLTEVTVAGFRVTNFRGARSADGSFGGSGDLHLPIGPTVSATFQVDRSGHVTSGSWSGNFTRLGETFSVSSGALDDGGLHWDRTLTVPLLGNTQLRYTWKANGSFLAEGSGSYNLAGSPVRFSLVLDSDQKSVRGTFDGALSLFGRSFGDAHFVLNAQGISGTARLDLGAGQGVTFQIAVSPSGAFSATGAGAFVWHGFTVENASLSLTQARLSGTGRLKLGAALSADAAFEISGQQMSGTIANLTLGGFGFREVSFGLGPAGFSGSGKATLPLLSQLTMSLSLSPAGAVSGSASGALSLAGFSISSASLSLENGRIRGNGSIALPGGSQGALDFTIAPDGGVQGTMGGALRIFGWQLAGASFALGNQALSGSGELSLPGGSKLRVNATLTSNGAFSATGSGGITLAGFSLAQATVTVSNETLSGTGQLGLPGGSQGQLAFNVRSDGTLSGSMSGALGVLGWNLLDTSFALSNQKLSGTGKVRLPGGSDATVTAELAAGGAFSAQGNGVFRIASREVSEGSFSIGAQGFSGTGKIAILGAKAAFTLQAQSSGTVTGTAGGDLTLPLPGGKSVGLKETALSLSSDGTISGTGKLSLANHTLSDCTFSARTDGTLSGKGKVQIGSQKIDCDFSISPSGGLSLSGSASASASKSVSFGISSASISLSATVTLSAHNVNELKASASGTASGKIAGVSKSASVSGEVNLSSGEFSVSVFGKSITFDLF